MRCWMGCSKFWREMEGNISVLGSKDLKVENMRPCSKVFSGGGPAILMRSQGVVG